MTQTMLIIMMMGASIKVRRQVCLPFGSEFLTLKLH